MKFQGAMTAVVTPMRDGRADFDAMGALIEEQIAAGIDALVAVGTTGESATLNMREHVEVIELATRAVAGRIPVIAGAGGNATAEALELTRAAERAGADGVLHVTPYYNKPTQDGLYRHFKTVAGATGLPVILYNVPGRTSCDLLPETVARLCEVDNIVAIKEATGSVLRATEIIERCGDRMTVLSGDDATAYPLYTVGALGVISVLSNIWPQAMAGMWDAAAAGDWAGARAWHYRIQPLTRLLFVESNPIPVKAALALAGKITGEIRAPLYPCSEALRERLRAQMQADGLLAP